jgi:hypothetical protein
MDELVSKQKIAEVEVSKVKATGKTIITSDDGNMTEIENPELLLIKKKMKG